jgi:hypothetical protein
MTHVGVYIEPLESRRLFTGVTLITHGFNSSVSGWVTAMGNAIAAQNGPLAQQPIYQMTVTDPGHTGGTLQVNATRLGPAPASWSSTEIIVLLDWSDVAGTLPFGGYHRTTGDVGAAVADKLLGAFSIPDLSTPLAQLPMHMIGHSRGASLISEIAGDVGKRGVWVDQLTYLDPHPVDGVRDPLNINWNDAPMHVYDSVQFADDYWRTQGDTNLDFTGEPVNGAHNLQLSETILSNGGSGLEHSDVHLWYHGTIGPPFSNTDGSDTVGPNWYDPPQGPRDSLGWHYSRIAKGVRPTDGLKSSGAFRDPVTLSVSGAAVWDDIQISGLLSDFTISQGSTIPVTVNFEDRNTGGTRDSVITIGLDRDDNPFNGFATTPINFPTSLLGVDTTTANVPTSGISGGYRVFARISNGTNTRYYYAPARAIITASGASETWIGPASGNWSSAANWSGGIVPAAGDSVAIYNSAVSITNDTKIGALSLTGTSSLDLHQSDLLIDYAGSSPIATIDTLLASGVSAAAGIYSSDALAQGGRREVGEGDGSDVI